MTPLMKPRRDTDCCVSSDIFLSSIAGSPRRVGKRPDGEGLGPHTINPYGCPVQRLFHTATLKGSPYEWFRYGRPMWFRYEGPDVFECHPDRIGRHQLSCYPST